MSRRQGREPGLRSALASWGGTPRTGPAHPGGGWSRADSRQELWSAQPSSRIPCCAQARAYSRSTGQGHRSPWAHAHSIRSHRATKGSGSTRAWQRANTEAVFRSWHCSHRPCGKERPPRKAATHAAGCPLTSGLGDPPRPEIQDRSLTPRSCLSTSVR